MTTKSGVPQVAVVGSGYWGPNLTRNFAELPGRPLAAVCDLRADRVQAMQQRYPWIQPFTSITALLAAPGIDAVAIATPAETHHALARQALLASKHVLVEKPLATSPAECAELVELAQRKGLTLMVGHTFLYNPGLRYIRSLITSGELGDVLYVTSRRLNLGQVRQDVNVVWNLAPHDIAIILHLLGQRPTRVIAQGLHLLRSTIADVAFLHFEFAAGQAAQAHVSWLDPRKVREVVVVGTRKMVVFDDVNLDQQVQVYDKGVEWVGPDGNGRPAGRWDQFESYGEYQLLMRSGDLVVPRIRQAEPLREETAHFLDCIRQGSQPLSNGINGWEVVKVLAAASASVAAGGAASTLDWSDEPQCISASAARQGSSRG